MPTYSLFVIFLFLVSLFLPGEAGKHERRLINDLFLHYNKFERPVGNESEPVQLNFGVRLVVHDGTNYFFFFYNFIMPPNKKFLNMINCCSSIQQIVDLDEKNQIMTSNIWLTLEWVDDALTWNTSEYGGIMVSI